MSRKQVIAIAGLVIMAFGGGVWMGSRIGGDRKAPAHSPVTLITHRPPAPDPPAAGSASDCVDIQRAGSLIDKKGCVQGMILRVFTARSGNTFLDFCQDYRTCPFTSVIFASDKDKFGDLESLQGKRVEIRGDVISYQDHAEIIIHDPQQVRSAP
jgi:hypothetical protein